jgi:hypothetical protein
MLTPNITGLFALAFQLDRNNSEKFQQIENNNTEETQ